MFLEILFDYNWLTLITFGPSIVPHIEIYFTNAPHLRINSKELVYCFHFTGNVAQRNMTSGFIKACTLFVIMSQQIAQYC